MRVTADALESAEMLVEFAIPQFEALDPSDIQIDPELGTLPEPATADLPKLLREELSDALCALRKARRHTVAVVDQTDKMYPKAK